MYLFCGFHELLQLRTCCRATRKDSVASVGRLFYKHATWNYDRASPAILQWVTRDIIPYLVDYMPPNTTRTPWEMFKARAVEQDNYDLVMAIIARKDKLGTCKNIWCNLLPKSKLTSYFISYPETSRMSDSIMLNALMRNIPEFLDLCGPVPRVQWLMLHSNWRIMHELTFQHRNLTCSFFCNSRDTMLYFLLRFASQSSKWRVWFLSEIAIAVLWFCKSSYSHGMQLRLCRCCVILAPPIFLNYLAPRTIFRDLKKLQIWILGVLSAITVLLSAFGYFYFIFAACVFALMYAAITVLSIRYIHLIIEGPLEVALSICKVCIIEILGFGLFYLFPPSQ